MNNEKMMSRWMEGHGERFEAVFAEFVRKHVGWIYGVARRRTGDAVLAEDVTQGVFLVVVRERGKVGRLEEGGEVRVARWMFGVVCNLSSRAVRDRSRRRRHESAAGEERGRELSKETEGSEWGEIAPMLDEWVGKLRQEEREAVLLRFYRRMSFAEVGGALGVSEEAARKRVVRAVERLREFAGVKGSGAGVVGGGLGAVMWGNMAEAAPVGLAGAVTTGGLSTQIGVVSAGATGLVGEGVGLVWMKVAAAVVLMVVGGGTAMAVWAGSGGREVAMGVSAVERGVGEAPTNAAGAYREAGKLLVVEGPASSDLEYPEYPPFTPAWHERAKDAWEKNAPARALVREARKFGTLELGEGDLKFLNDVRALANEVSDAAIWSHMNGDDREALELLRDVKHLTMLLRNSSDQADALVRILVAEGVDALLARTVMVMAPGLEFGERGTASVLTSEEGKGLMAMLLDRPGVEVQFEMAMKHERERLGAEGAEGIARIERLRETLRRVYAENVLAAMSVAAQMYRSEHRKWPGDAGDLVPKYLAEIPVDPWGDGKERFGYVLVKGGLPEAPDGGDRPLVYSRAESRDGLFYVVNEPKYSFYQGDGSKTPLSKQKFGGQFRDVARWVPRGDVPAGAPTTRAIGR